MLERGTLKQAFAGLKQGLNSALEGAAQIAAVVADEAPRLVSQSSTLRDYKLGKPVATCGPENVWAIYSGTSKKAGAVQKSVAIWILDKKRLTEAAGKAGGKPRAYDAFFEQQKHNCVTMMRLKHPGVVKVIEPLEDTAQQMVLVTEPVFGSLRNVLSHFSGVPGVTTESTGVTLSPLEVKMGLVRVSETLNFLHSEAHLVHAGICPASIIVTQAGAWKLAGFGWSVSAQRAGASTGQFSYDSGGEGYGHSYNEGSYQAAALWEELARPSLSYVAPEQVLGRSGSLAGVSSPVSAAADVFSLALVAIEAVTGKPLISPRSVTEYREQVNTLSNNPLSSVPIQLQGVLRLALSLSPVTRPPLTTLLTCGYFQDDVLLRALRFLDTVIQRDYAHKVAFVNDLKHFWNQYDDRVLQLYVLPPLIQEMRDPLLQPSLVPLLLSMLDGHCTPTYFQDTLLPLIAPVLEGAQGEVLTALVAGSGTLAALMTGEMTGRHLVPLYTRALDSEGQPHVQETCLRMLKDSMSRLDYQLLKTHIMPRVHAVCMRTTTAAVRVHAIAFMTAAVQRMDKEECAAMIDTVTQVVSVDRSAGTLLSVSQLCAAISQQYGAEVTASRLLPLLCPLLLASSLNVNQLKELFATAQGMLDRVQSKLVGAASAMEASGAAASQGMVTWDTAPLTGGSGLSPAHRNTTPTSQQQPSTSVNWQSSLAGPSTSTSSKPASQATTQGNWSDSLMGAQTTSTGPPAAAGPSWQSAAAWPQASSSSQQANGHAHSTLGGGLNGMSSQLGGMAMGGTSGASTAGAAADDLFGGLSLHEGSSGAHSTQHTRTAHQGSTQYGGSGLGLGSGPMLGQSLASGRGPGLPLGAQTGQNLASMGSGGGGGRGGMVSAGSGSGDPFASLNAIALSAQMQPHPPKPPPPPIPVLAAPPRASTAMHTVQGPTSQGGAKQPDIDLLW